MTKFMSGLVLVLVVLVVALPATTQAQVRLGGGCTATQDAYTFEGICEPNEPPEEPPQLPFTGAEAGVAGGAGLLLLLMGVGMRRATRGQRD